jgi:protocatechuate 3,4-dioxygenase, alpha subunit
VSTETSTPAWPTPSQTIGPFFRFGMDWFEVRDLVAPGTPGAVTITGRVLDGAGDPVPDALVEIWQADADGHFPAPVPAGAEEAGGDGSGAGWHGWGRCLTDEDGGFAFTTLPPGRVDGEQAPHIDVHVFARGLLQRLVTRIYLPDDPANAADPVLLAAGPRASTLVAEPAGPGALHHDLVLQGERETVFFVW